MCVLSVIVGEFFKFAKISGLTWRRSIFEKEHIWFVAEGKEKEENLLEMLPL